MPNLIILAGVPGSGKSTWAKGLLAQGKYAIVSTDTIRRNRYGSLKVAHAANSNEEIFMEFERQIADCLAHDIDVVADATFLTRESRDTASEIAALTGSRVHLVLFKNIQQAIARNAVRDEDTCVPEDVMQVMMTKYYDTLAEIIQESYDSVTTIGTYS